MRDYLDESNPWIVNQLFLRINEISDYLRSAVLAVKYGMVYLKRAMVSGNYYKATGGSVAVCLVYLMTSVGGQECTMEVKDCRKLPRD